jgi:hypothetical protein
MVNDVTRIKNMGKYKSNIINGTDRYHANDPGHDLRNDAYELFY